MVGPLGSLVICALTGTLGGSEAVNTLVEPKVVILVVGGEAGVLLRGLLLVKGEGPPTWNSPAPGPGSGPRVISQLQLRQEEDSYHTKG